MGAPPSEKALRYIQQLDEARCAGNWKGVPELCRKVEKHASQRKCLALTARTEAQIAAFIIQRPTSSKLSEVIPLLLSAIEEQGHGDQDAFQAAVCLGWLHYVLGEPGLAIARLPKKFGVIAKQFSSGGERLTGWSKVCLVKGTYLRASALEKTGANQDAIIAFFSIMPWLSTLVSSKTNSTQFKMWSEHLLLRMCQISDQSKNPGELVNTTSALQAYRCWARFWDATAISSGSDATEDMRSRRHAWKAYYDTLSTILRHGMSYEPEDIITTPENSVHHDISLQLRQRSELKRVETMYEYLLIKETQFPKATDSNREVEAWVDSVVHNWRFLNGPMWSNASLGEGGKEGVARSVLDILYRAAMKTFHSTQILRHLFIVHASLAEFDLAVKAYDSYVEIITRGKDRAEKSVETDVGIDDDSTILRTSSEAILLLCRFGSRKDAGKAIEIGYRMNKWLEQSQHTQATLNTSSITSATIKIEPSALAEAFCALGISHAHWARLSYQVETRAELQTKAIHYFRQALSPSLGDSIYVEAMYALALVLAEKRDISAAINVVKRALTPDIRDNITTTDGAISPGLTTKFGRERKLIPLWHLLALLLTSRSDFTAAERACEAAFEQFGDVTVLFGSEESNAFRSEHLNQAADEKSSARHGVVDRMGTFEKAAIIQIKMTQLSLLEVTDGASVAVDSCDELTALYGRLFGDPAAERSNFESLAKVSAVIAPPKSAVGTIRGSIFRGKDLTKAVKEGSAQSSSAIASSRSSTFAVSLRAPPAIQVTNEDVSPSANGHHHHHLLDHNKAEISTLGTSKASVKLQKRSLSLRRTPGLDYVPTPEVPQQPESSANGSPKSIKNVRSHSPGRQSLSGAPRQSIEGGDRMLGPVAHNLSQTKPPPPVDYGGRLKQGMRLSAPVPDIGYIPPAPYFSTLQERRQKVTLLSSVWIFIAGLYTRAYMFDDATEAVEEALKLVEVFEVEVASETFTAQALSDQGWGGGKSVEELWADAYTTRGELFAAQSSKHIARADFERALLHFPDHPQAIVGLSDILLDIYSEVIPFEPSDPQATTTMLPASAAPSSTAILPKSLPSITPYLTSHIPSAENQLSPPELNRLAARDRAFGLLSTLTKLGTGWDYSEAWYALAKAYEESGQIEKTKEVLWWCVELEDTHPIRNWWNINMGGFVL